MNLILTHKVSIMRRDDDAEGINPAGAAIEVVALRHVSESFVVGPRDRGNASQINRYESTS